jgi:triacylglycerol lipase
MRRSRSRVLALLVAASVVLASCGDDDETSDPAPTTSDPGTIPSDDLDSDDVDGSDSDAITGPVDVELSEPAAALAAAVSCPPEREHPEAPGVLLIPGTGLGSEGSWSLTMGAALPGERFDTCTVDLVDTATGDIQRSAEYVVAAIRSMVDDGYDQIAVVGFSQGVLAARWALTWWPDVREPVVDLIGIAGPSGGAAATVPLCAEACAAALHQMTAGSDFLTALDAAWSGGTRPAVTLIASTTDTVIALEEVDAIDGATLVVVQDICPDREVDHVEMLADGVVFAIVLDALGNAGPGSADRLDAGVCDSTGIGADTWDASAVSDGAFGVILTAPMVPDEPPLASYASI